MTREEKWQKYCEWRERLNAFGTALIITRLDNDSAPVLGRTYRTEMRTILAGEYERLKRDDSIYEILLSLKEEALTEERDAGREEAAEILLRLAQMEKDRAVPAEKALEYAAILDESVRAWLAGKAEGKAADYKAYAPYLDALIGSYKEITALKAGAINQKKSLQITGTQETAITDGALTRESLYDYMLDEHQPGWNRDRYDRFFAGMKNRIVPLLQEIKEAEPVPEEFLHRGFPAEQQRIFMRCVTEYMRFTDDWGRLSESEHPLTTPVCRGDVRISTKYRENNPVQAVFSTVHEIGHAYYTHHLDERFEGKMIGYAISAGMNESQSRLTENHLARSRAFWEALFPEMKAVFPEQLRGITAEQLWRAANAVKPSTIRTEADEVTYPLHIMIRYELEKEMMDGSLRAADLEEAWNAKYQEYMGVCPANAAEGILQDMHWSYAYFGYFPTYALGSAAAAQIFSKMSAQIDVPACLRENRVDTIEDWLGEHVHRTGALYSMEETIARACGEPFSEEYYFRYLEEKYREIYGLAQ
ncbi:MAG: carboxypeptidase M32 [Lachnospiraceae bacterium]|nr:carboxypeptidase M32 [Lachnospiraceae bacterium]